MNLYCDNYRDCRSLVFDQGSRTEDVARARGWHLFDGTSQDGREQHIVLCKRCMGARVRDLAPAPETLDGQLELF